jgi:hypothetical protein
VKDGFDVRFVGGCYLYFTAKPMPLPAPVMITVFVAVFTFAFLCPVTDEIDWLFGLANLRRTSTRMRRATPRL